MKLLDRLLTADVVPGSVVSLQGFVQYRLVHFRLGQLLLQSPVLFLELFEPLGLLGRLGSMRKHDYQIHEIARSVIGRMMTSEIELKPSLTTDRIGR